MVDLTWPKALAWVRADEGGNDDDPADSGGRTSRGITQREYTAYCRLHQLDEPSDVWKARDPIIDSIYSEEYWDPWCPLLPVGVDYLFFNMNVNAGMHRAIVLLQRSVGVADDGHIGPITKLAVAKADPKDLITRYTAASKAFYTHLAQQAAHDRKFLAGWLHRADRVDERAKSLVAGEGQSTGV